MGEVNAKRGKLNDLRQNDPKAFALAVGFRDPTSISYKDLKAISSNLQPTKNIQSAPSATSGIGSTLLKPIILAFKASITVIKKAFGIVFGERINEEQIEGYSSINSQLEIDQINPNGKDNLKFYQSNISGKKDEAPSAIFEIRQTYRTTPLLGILPHNPFVFKSENLSSDNLGVYFNKDSAEYISALKKADSIDLYVHGYNVRAKKSDEIREKFNRNLKDENYSNLNSLISWSGDVGNNSFARLFYFNRATRSADLSIEKLTQTIDFIRSHNPDIKINVITHSLGARVILDAANEGMKFNTVILLVPAVDNESLSVGGRYEKGVQNIEKLVVVHSRNQKWVFGAFKIGQFDRALGYGGPTGTISHPNFYSINATNPKLNKYQIHVEDHGDIYDNELILMLKDHLLSTGPGRI